jgi:hypothetical protein
MLLNLCPPKLESHEVLVSALGHQLNWKYSPWKRSKFDGLVH